MLKGSLISLKNVSNNLWDKPVLKNITWSTEFGQSWGIIGPNGAGKSILMKIILGQLPYCGTIIRNKKVSSFEKIASVSFEQQKLISIHEGKKDWYEEFSGKKEKFLNGREFMDPGNKKSKKLQTIAQQLKLVTILRKPIRHFSNGELRKALIVKALLINPELMILDEPFDGLDISSVKWLKKTISKIINNGSTIWLVSHRFDEIVPEITHILCLKSGEVFDQGLRQKILTPIKIQRLYRKKNLESFKKLELGNKNLFNKKILPPHPTNSSQKKQKLKNIIEMVNVNISYGGKKILKNFNWTVKRGENWKIIGPNGAGKSTILSLISGDNLQTYSNEVYIFGIRRGSGESIWDIKKKIGLVSSEFQLHYREPIEAIKVVISGFFDTIGYYKRPSKKQMIEASKCLDLLGINNLAKHNFTRLSFGQQRLILIARALVKSPSLLIFDEPCQGLDFSNRNHILEIIDKIAKYSNTQILYVTHVLSDQLQCMHHELRFELFKDDEYQTIIL